MTEPTLKQWKRRALSAEEEITALNKLGAFNATQQMSLARENATLRVALREIQEAGNWAYGVIDDGSMVRTTCTQS